MSFHDEEEKTDPGSGEHYARIVDELIRSRDKSREDFVALCSALGLTPVMGERAIMSWRIRGARKP